MLTDILEFSSLELFRKNLDGNSSLSKVETKVEIKFLDPKSCKKIAVKNKWQTNFTVGIDEILEDSDICVIAEVDGYLAHWTHITYKSAYVSEIMKRIWLVSESAYLHGIYTAKDFRKIGIASTVIEKIEAYLHEKGIRELYVLIDSHNNSMLRVATKAGFKEIGKVKIIKIGKLKLYRYKGIFKVFLSQKNADSSRSNTQ